MATKSATTGNWQIDVLEDGKVEVTQYGVFVKNVRTLSGQSAKRLDSHTKRTGIPDSSARNW